jgi:hypothetical protein
VIVGLNDETEAYAPGVNADFHKRLSETNTPPGKPFFMPNGTPFFCAADGTLLKNGLADWDKLPPELRKPGALIVPDAQGDWAQVKKVRRLIKPPTNALILRSYKRGLTADEQGRLAAPEVIAWAHNMKLPAEPNRDFVWLQEAEWKALIPDNPVKGHRFAIPAAVRDRICYWHIAGGYHCLPGYYTADAFQSLDMTLTVEEVKPEEVALRLRGSAVVKGGPTYQFHGHLKYDPAKKVFLRFDIVAVADEGHAPKPRLENVAPFRYYGVAFELAGERTDDLLPPFYAREHAGTLEKYFANSAR